MTWNLLYDQTIEAYYAGRFADGRMACDRLLADMDAPGYARVTALRNAVHYAPTLRSDLPGYSETPLRLPDSVSGPGSRAVVALLADGAPFVLASTGPGQFVLAGFGHDGTLVGSLALAAGDAGELPLQLPDPAAIVVVENAFHVAGAWERIGGNGAGEPSCFGLARIDVPAARLQPPAPLLPAHSGFDETCWFVAQGEDACDVIASLAPVLALRPARAAEDRQATPVSERPGPYLAASFRPAAPFLPDGDGWMGLVRTEAEWSDGGTSALHRLVRLDAGYSLTHFSHPFRFHGGSSECATALRDAGDSLVIGFLAESGEAWVARAPRETMLGWLMPYSALEATGQAEAAPHVARRLRRKPRAPLPQNWDEILAGPAYLLNLDRRSDRLPRARQAIAAAGFADVRRFRAIDGLDPDELAAAWALRGSPPLAPPPHDMRDSPGMQACLLSHLAIWDAIEAEGRDWAVVFEDDVLFHPRWRDQAPAFWAETPRDFDLLYLGGRLYCPPDDPLVVRRPSWLTHAYLVTRDGIPSLREALAPGPDGLRAIDVTLVGHQLAEVEEGVPAPFVWRAWNKPAGEPAGNYPFIHVQDRGLVFQDRESPGDCVQIRQPERAAPHQSPLAAGGLTSAGPEAQPGIAAAAVGSATPPAIESVHRREKPSDPRPAAEATLVTAFFDLGRAGWTYYRRSADFYFAAFERMARLSNPLVVFTSPEFAGRVREARARAGSPGPMHVVEIPDFRAGHEELLARIRDCLHSDAFRASAQDPTLPERASADYVLLTQLKLDFVQRAIDLGLVSTPIVAWLDFGYCRDDATLGGLTVWESPFDPGKVHVFAVQKPDHASTLREVVLSGEPFISASSIVAGVELWPELAALARSQLLRLLDAGLADDEQTVLLMCILERPDLFQVQQADVAESGWFVLLTSSPYPAAFEAWSEERLRSHPLRLGLDRPDAGFPVSWNQVLEAPVYVIDLARVPERLGPMAQRVQAAGYLDLRGVMAVDAFRREDLDALWRDLGVDSLDGADDEFRSRPGEQARFLSHAGIWRRMAGANVQMATILEDDGWFHERWSELAPRFYAATDRDCHLIWLGPSLPGARPHDRLGGPVREPAEGVHAYMLSAEGARRLLGLVAGSGLPLRNLDQFLFRAQQRIAAGDAQPVLDWRAWDARGEPSASHPPLEKGGLVVNSGLVFSGRHAAEDAAQETSAIGLMSATFKAHALGDLAAGRLACDRLRCLPAAWPAILEETRRNQLFFLEMLASLPGARLTRIGLGTAGETADPPSVGIVGGRPAVFRFVRGAAGAPRLSLLRLFPRAAPSAEGDGPHTSGHWRDVPLPPALRRAASVRCAMSGADAVLVAAIPGGSGRTGTGIGVDVWRFDPAAGLTGPVPELAGAAPDGWLSDQPVAVWQGGMLAMTRFEPAEVWRWGRGASPELVARHPGPRLAQDLAGGAPLVAFDGGWLTVARERTAWPRGAALDAPPAGRYADGVCVLHRLVHLDGEFRIRAISHPFAFRELGHEACDGIALAADQAWFAFDAASRETWVATLPLEEVIRMLIPAGFLVPPSA